MLNKIFNMCPISQCNITNKYIINTSSRINIINNISRSINHRSPSITSRNALKPCHRIN